MNGHTDFPATSRSIELPEQLLQAISSCFHLFLQCVDLSCNELSEVTLPENLPPKLQELDLTGNPRLALDHKTLELLK